jgi:hypothetical protein
LVNFSHYRFRIVKSKAFMISEALDEANNIDGAASALGLDKFKKLLSENKKPRSDDQSGKAKNNLKRRCLIRY